jgi:hypothetical protein
MYESKLAENSREWKPPKFTDVSFFHAPDFCEWLKSKVGSLVADSDI